MTAKPSDLPTAESVEQHFRRLEAVWQAETMYLSDPRRITDHWAFQEILGMGDRVVPLMLSDLAHEPRLWVWALPQITGENPVPSGVRGNIREMTEAWLRWGREKGRH